MQQGSALIGSTDVVTDESLVHAADFSTQVQDRPQRHLALHAGETRRLTMMEHQPLLGAIVGKEDVWFTYEGCWECDAKARHHILQHLVQAIQSGQ